MNNTFNFNRFNKVLAYDWKRFIRNFGITLLVWIINLPREGVGFAMMPATNLEKFFSMFLYCSLVTPVVTLVGSWLVDCLMTLLPFGGFKDFAMYEDFLRNISFGDFMMLAVSLVTAAWAESSIFMFGNMVFKRRKAGKTFAWGLLIVFSFTLLMQLFHLLVIAIVFYVLTYRKIKTQKY